MLRTQIYILKELHHDIHLVAKEEKKGTIGKALLKLTRVKTYAPADTSMKIDDFLYNEKES
jgi:hypothetical protein